MSEPRNESSAATKLGEGSGVGPMPSPGSSAACKPHKWVEAPRSLLAMFICSTCGRDSMVKYAGRCSGGR